MVIKIVTKYGGFNDVPNTTWSELEPYWPDMIASIIEVLHENEFNISEVRKDNPTGFVASTPYWKLHAAKPKRYPLNEVKRFISCLKQKPRFVQAITSFNLGHNTNWLSEEKNSTLGGFLCSLCAPILEYLRGLKR